MRPQLIAVRLLACFLLLVGLANIATQHLPPTWWSAPIVRGPIAAGWEVTDIQRTPDQFRFIVQKGREWSTLSVRNRPIPRAKEEGLRAGTYVLERPSSTQIPDEVFETLATRLSKASAAPRPPFIRQSDVELSGLERLQWGLASLLFSLTLFGSLWDASTRVRRPPLWPLAASLLIAGAVFWMPDTIWHSNNHGYDRAADIALNTPTPAANLSRLHGYGFYVLHHLFTPFTTEVFTSSRLLWLLGLWVWWGVMKQFTGRRDLATIAIGFLALAPLSLRLATSASMYIPVVLFMGAGLYFLHRAAHSQRAVDLWLGVGWMVLLAQSRAEWLVLAPLVSALCLLPSATAWVKRPAFYLATGGAAFALLPRLLTMLAELEGGNTPPPTVAGVFDPRIFAVAGLLLLAVPLRRGRRLLDGAGIIAIVVGSLWTTHHGQAHWVFSPSQYAPWLAGLIVLGAFIGRQQAPTLIRGTLLFLALALWLYLPQYDAYSTYTRTGLATLPAWALLGAYGADWISQRLPSRLRPWAIGAILLGGTLWGWEPLTHQWTKQVQWQALVNLSAPPKTTAVIYLANEDVVPLPPTTRINRIDVPKALRWQYATFSVQQWTRGEAADFSEAVFVWTADCHRPLYDTPSQRAWVGERWTSITPLPVPDSVVTPGLRVDGVSAYTDPACAKMLELGDAQQQFALQEANTGSFYEQVVGTQGWIGVVNIPASPPSLTPQ